MDDQAYEIWRYEKAAELLPVRLRRFAMQQPDFRKAAAEEFRLRVGHPVTLLLPEGELPLAPGSRETVAQSDDLERMVGAVTEYARYASAEMLRGGYLTVKGGFRIGLCGTAVMREGHSHSLKDFSSLALRISRERQGIAAEVLTQLFEGERFCSTLLLSPPGCGKTTLLRELIRCLSDGSEERLPLRMAVIDERGEIAVVHSGVPQMAVGCHTDVLDGCPKAQGIPMVLRAMNPQVIAVDEITVSADIEAMLLAANCGVGLLATIHGADRGCTASRSTRRFWRQRSLQGL